jgi:hypothetical protein
MDLKQKARELVGEAVKAFAEEGGEGSIPGPVIGWLIKKGEIKKPGGKRRKGGKKLKRKYYNRPDMRLQYGRPEKIKGWKRT